LGTELQQIHSAHRPSPPGRCRVVFSIFDSYVSLFTESSLFIYKVLCNRKVEWKRSTHREFIKKKVEWEILFSRPDLDQHLFEARVMRLDPLNWAAAPPLPFWPCTEYADGSALSHCPVAVSYSGPSPAPIAKEIKMSVKFQ
jgi:hypothetical protein